MLVQLSKIPSLVTSRDSSLSPVFLLSRLTCRFVSALKIQRAPGGERAVVRALDDAVLNARRIAISSLLFSSLHPRRRALGWFASRAHFRESFSFRDCEISRRSHGVDAFRGSRSHPETSTRATKGAMNGATSAHLVVVKVVDERRGRFDSSV